MRVRVFLRLGDSGLPDITPVVSVIPRGASPCQSGHVARRIPKFSIDDGAGFMATHHSPLRHTSRNAPKLLGNQIVAFSESLLPDLIRLPRHRRVLRWVEAGSFHIADLVDFRRAGSFRIDPTSGRPSAPNVRRASPKSSSFALSPDLKYRMSEKWR